MKRVVRASKDNLKIVGTVWKQFLIDIDEEWGFKASVRYFKFPRYSVLFHRDDDTKEYIGQVDIKDDGTFEIDYDSIIPYETWLRS